MGQKQLDTIKPDKIYVKKIRSHNYRMAFESFTVIQVRGVVVNYKLNISKSRLVTIFFF